MCRQCPRTGHGDGGTRAARVRPPGGSDVRGVLRQQEPGKAKPELEAYIQAQGQTLEAIQARLALSRAELDAVYHRFTELADRKKTIYDQDLIGLLQPDKSAVPA